MPIIKIMVLLERNWRHRRWLLLMQQLVQAPKLEKEQVVVGGAVAVPMMGGWWPLLEK